MSRIAVSQVRGSRTKHELEIVDNNMSDSVSLHSIRHSLNRQGEDKDNLEGREREGEGREGGRGGEGRGGEEREGREGREGRRGKEREGGEGRGREGGKS